jgi:predicted PurR-regulated permease PerM
VSIVFAAYILLTKEKIKKGFKRFVKVWLPNNFGEFFYHAASIANINFKNFIFGQFFESVITGVLCFVGMIIFRFPYAAMTSVLVGVTALIPVIGGLIGGIIGALIIITVDPIKAIWFVLYLLILQQTEGNIIYPKLMGGRLNLPGIGILAAVTIGGGVAGPIGMLLGVPIAATVYALFKEATDNRELILKNRDIDQ